MSTSTKPIIPLELLLKWCVPADNRVSASSEFKNKIPFVFSQSRAESDTWSVNTIPMLVGFTAVMNDQHYCVRSHIKLVV